MTATMRLPVPHADNYDWQRDAACRSMGSEVFFHPENERGGARHDREAQAKQVCARCPVAQACLNHALEVGEPYGVWGGLSEDERRHLTDTGKFPSGTVHEVAARKESDGTGRRNARGDGRVPSARQAPSDSWDGHSLTPV